VSDILSDDKGNSTFSSVRIGYRGVCIESTTGKDKDSSWTCAPTGSEIFGSSLGGDPIDLVSIGDVFKDKISFSTPLIVSAIFLGLAWLCVAINCIPAIPIPAVTRKVAAVSASAGTLLFCGAMVLQQVTTGAVETLVARLGVGAVLIDVGNADIAFGWAAFALAVVAAVATAAVAAAEYAVAKAQ
ncbi:Ca2+ regulator and membrane fusion protein Fig1-domain-containing protein, partial [Geopyxis carbonaria]